MGVVSLVQDTILCDSTAPSYPPPSLVCHPLFPLVFCSQVESPSLLPSSPMMHGTRCPWRSLATQSAQWWWYPMPLPLPLWSEDHWGGCRQFSVSREAPAQEADYGAAQEGIKVGNVSDRALGMGVSFPSPLLLLLPPPRFPLIFVMCFCIVIIGTIDIILL